MDWCQCLQCGQGEGWTGVCLQCGQGEGWTGVSVFGGAKLKGGRSDWCCRCLRCGQGEGWTDVVNVYSVARVMVGLVLSVFVVWPG